MKYGIEGKNETYVYALMDGRKPGPFRYGRFVFAFEPFYIGKGVRRRAFAHIEIALRRHSKPSPRTNKIRKILRQGSEVVIRIMKRRLTDTDAIAYERKIIARVGRNPIGPLVNLTDGGEGMAGYRASASTKQKQAAGVKKSWTLRTPAEKAAAINKRNLHPNYWDDPKKRAAASLKISESLRRTNQAKSSKELEAFYAKRRKSIIEYHANRTPAQKQAASEARRRSWLTRKQLSPTGMGYGKDQS